MPSTPRSRPAPPPWLSESNERELEWPSFASSRPKGRSRSQPSKRVEYLFPAVDDADWSVTDFGEKRPRSRRSA
jgi:hypothetical protein